MKMTENKDIAMIIKKVLLSLFVFFLFVITIYDDMMIFNIIMSFMSIVFMIMFIKLNYDFVMCIVCVCKKVKERK